MTDFIQRGGLWVIGQFAILLAIAVLGIAFHPQANHPAVFRCGLVLLLASAVCSVAGVLTLRRNLTPFPKPASGAQLVQQGIYGWMRHPLYTSVICAAVGWSLVRASWPALVASLVLALFLDAKARHEEQWLRRQFPDYAAYAQRVRRFLPWVY